MKQLFTLFLLLCLGTGVALAQKSFIKPLRFKKGTNGAMVQGVFAKGDEVHTYEIGAKAGQRMMVQLTGSHKEIVFTLGQFEQDPLVNGEAKSATVDLPETVTYFLSVSSNAYPLKKGNYKMKVTIL